MAISSTPVLVLLDQGLGGVLVVAHVVAGGDLEDVQHPRRRYRPASAWNWCSSEASSRRFLRMAESSSGGPTALADVAIRSRIFSDRSAPRRSCLRLLDGLLSEVACGRSSSSNARCLLRQAHDTCGSPLPPVIGGQDLLLLSDPALLLCHLPEELPERWDSSRRAGAQPVSWQSSCVTELHVGHWSRITWGSQGL